MGFYSMIPVSREQGSHRLLGVNPNMRKGKRFVYKCYIVKFIVFTKNEKDA